MASLLSEAIYLGKPVLSVPLHGQFEQVMDARYTRARGYRMARAAGPAEVAEFLARLPEFEASLAGYEQDGETASRSTSSRRSCTGAAADSRRRPPRARRWRGGQA